LASHISLHSLSGSEPSLNYPLLEMNTNSVTVLPVHPQHSKSTVSEAPFRRQKEKAKTANDIHSDENEWEIRLRDVILEDEELYLRILRFEPIHFDIFAGLAAKHRLEAHAFRKRLRKLFG